jgi:hypothetical protein
MLAQAEQQLEVLKVRHDQLSFDVQIMAYLKPSTLLS